MRSLHTHSPLTLIIIFFFLFSSSLATTTGECKPVTWQAEGDLRPATAITKAPFPRFTPSVPRKRPVEPGDINCRYDANTYKDVSCCTCKILAHRYGITIEKFFMLNPELAPYCSNIKPYTTYCVAGFIEPLRAWDGRCGPQHKNATCVGTDKQCCNSETWTCGDMKEDCAPGTCYEGICPGHKVYTTDGTCGYDYENRLCAGKWGDCCRVDGKCGTGEDFCGDSVCQSGSCTRIRDPGALYHWRLPPELVPFGLLLQSGNTTDGTCGGDDKYTCNVIYGNCCNKDGICGSLPEDCGDGCQSEFGNCDTIEPSVPSSASSTIA